MPVGAQEVCRFFETIGDFLDLLEKFIFEIQTEKNVKFCLQPVHGPPQVQHIKRPRIKLRKRATIENPKLGGLRPPKNRLIVSILDFEKSPDHGTPPQRKYFFKKNTIFYQLYIVTNPFNSLLYLLNNFMYRRSEIVEKFLFE